LAEVNRAAVQLAREVAGEERLVAGDICLTWKYDANSPKSHEEVRRLFDDQIRLQLEGGRLDFIIGETFLHVGEALLALDCIKKTGLPAMITMSFEGLRTRDGRSPSDAAKALEDAGADVVGANCWQDPERMLPTVEQMRQAVDCYVAAQPVAYRCTPEVPFFTGQPGFPDQLDSYQLTRYEMGDFARRARDLGVNYIGGCCGCQGAHIRQMARAIGKLPAEERHWSQDDANPQSATEAYRSLRQQVAESRS
jgi:betaine-homocysteine S-methyltransferase